MNRTINHGEHGEHGEKAFKASSLFLFPPFRRVRRVAVVKHAFA